MKMSEKTEKLGLEARDSMFSRGSTVTTEALEEIMRGVSDLVGMYHCTTKPIPEKTRAVFIEFLRGFEDYYLVKTGQELVLRTDILPNGGIGIAFRTPDGEYLSDDTKEGFAEWIYFALTDDPSHLTSFQEMPEKEQVLVQSFLRERERSGFCKGRSLLRRRSWNRHWPFLAYSHRYSCRTAR